jgi:hypothetical protein
MLDPDQFTRCSARARRVAVAVAAMAFALGAEKVRAATLPC